MFYEKMVFCIIPLVVVLMGCASAPTKPGGGGNDGTAQAAQLAKGLTAAKPGGTGHGDHGTGWVEGSLRMGDGAAVIAGTGTISLKSKGRLLNIGGGKGKRQLTLDGVTLVGLPDNDSPLVGIGENSEFVLSSGAITGNTHVSDKSASGGGVEVQRESSSFIMTGGTISGNSARDGGGVFVERGASFTKTGGTIYGDSDSTHTDGSTENTDRNNRGHAVHYQTDPKYRNATLGPGDNISTSNLRVNWDN
jgi:hypothetical protein